MKRAALALCILLLAALACGQPVTPAPTSLPIEPTMPLFVTQTPQIPKQNASSTVPPPYPLVTVTGAVNVRTLTGDATGNVLLKGAVVFARCDGTWCYIMETELKFWRGCSSDTAGLGCEAAKP